MEEDVSEGLYGTYPLVQSAEKKHLEFVDVENVTAAVDGKEVCSYGFNFHKQFQKRMLLTAAGLNVSAVLLFDDDCRFEVLYPLR